MAVRKLTPPTIRGGPEVRNRWEIAVSELLTNSGLSIDELGAMFLTLQRDESAEINYRLSEIERKLNFIDSEEIKQDLEEIRRLAWHSHQKSL